MFCEIDGKGNKNTKKALYTLKNKISKKELLQKCHRRDIWAPQRTTLKNKGVKNGFLQ